MGSNYYDLVPRDPIENLRWRIRCRERALTDFKFRYAFWQACMDDVCFFMAAVCWGYDPRAKHKIVPFIPYPHQEKVFRALDEAIDYTQINDRTLDVLVDKARAQGGTFGYLWVDLRRWLCDTMFSAGYVTRNADLVDSKTDSDTVLWKVQFAINMLPAWMRPRYERNLSQHTFENKDNGSLMKGYSAGQDVAAGGRATVFTMDEAGAKDFVSGGKDYAVMETLHDVTHCLRLVSARYIDSGVFHEACEAGGTEGGWHLVLDWKDHPVHSKHSYIVKDNIPVACKLEDAEAVAEYHKNKPNLRDLLEKKGYKYEGVVRSPWYDMRCVSWGTLVVTDRGLVPIQDVALNDCVWDGNMFVSHDGCVFQGWKETICSYQVGLTPDHPVLTVKGWKYAYEGFDRAEVWLPDGYRERYIKTYRCCVLGGSVRLRNGSDCESQRFNQWWSDKLWVPSQEHALQDSSLQFMGCNGAAMHEHQSSKVPVVWSERDNGLREMERLRKLLYGYGDSSKGSYARSYRQQWELRTWQLSMGDSKATAEQPPKHYAYRNSEWSYSDSRSSTYCGHDDQRSTGPHQERLDGGCDSASTQNPKPVYDLLNCGPRRAFTVIDDCGRPLLVHNCLRKTARPQLIASQLDRNPKGAVGKVFNHDLLERMKVMHSKNAVWKGNPVFDSETLELTGLIPREDGALTLWFKPGIDNSPPFGSFTIACDIASGGVSEVASNSVASGIDDRTGEQVLEYVIKGLEPRPFARRVVGLCLWMRKALLGWEDSGVSGGFAKEVMEVLYYGNIYFREVMQLGTQRKSRKPGFPCRDEDKADMLEQFAIALDQGSYVPRSKDMLIECGEYEWGNGKVVHAPSKNKGAANKNHGDRAIAAAGAWLVYSADKVIQKVDSDDEKRQNPEYGSFAWREMQERKIANAGSPKYGIRDVLRH